MRAMSSDGMLYPLPKWERGTCERDGSALLPTLTASEGGYNKGGAAGREGKERPTITTMVQKGLLPTLTVKGNYNRAGLSARSGDGLITALQRMPTLTARDWKSGKASPETHAKNARPLSEVIGGLLSPTWCEWYMGFPLEWSDVSEPSALRRLETAWYPRKAGKRGSA